MAFRKDAVVAAVAGLLASCGFTMADTGSITAPKLSLEPTVATAQESGAPSGLLMQGLDKIGVAKPLQNLGINIYGWVEGGYDLNLRRQSGANRIAPGPFTSEPGNHVAFNQIDLRIEKLVDSKKFDVGGAVDFMFGDDTNYIQTNGIEYQTPGDNPGEVPHFDIPQAYVDVNIPIGNGLKIRAGLFYTLIGYETVDPRGNQFYSKSYLWNLEPVSNTGVLGFYQINDQWAVAGGITRGWNQSTEDNNGTPDIMAQVTYTPNKQWQFMFNTEIGPNDDHDNSHWDILLNPIVVWQATDKLKLAAEGLYDEDGGYNGDAPFVSHAYGDDYGVAVYGSYTLNDYFTLNARAEWAHTYLFGFGSGTGFKAPSLNFYDVTLGVTIKPLPKDPIGQNLSIRPEIRYDFSEDKVYSTGNNAYRDQFTFGADVIFTF